MYTLCPRSQAVLTLATHTAVDWKARQNLSHVVMSLDIRPTNGGMKRSCKAYVFGSVAE